MAEKLPRFGATDFYLLETDAGAIKEEIRAALAEFLGYTPTDADVYMNTALALMPYLVQTRALADAAAKSTLLNYAIGQNLDRVADATCVAGYLDRLPAQRAFLPVQVDFSSYLPTPTESAPQSVPWSVDISFDANGKSYSGNGRGTCEKYTYTTGGVMYYAYYSRKIIYCFCSETGEGGNISLAQADEMQLASIVSNGLTAKIGTGSALAENLSVAVYGAAGGAEIESDDAFAERVRVKQIAIRVPGSSEYYTDLLSTAYGLRDLYVPKVPYSPREGYEEEEAAFAGAVQVLFVGDAPMGSPVDFNPPAPDDDRPMSERLKEMIEAGKLMGDRVMLRPALPRTTLQRFSVHYSMPVGADAASVNAVVAAYSSAIDLYCYRIGIVVNFDDIAARLVAAGAFDASVKYGTLTPANLDLYENEYLSAQSIELVRDEDTEPIIIPNPATPLVDVTLIE